jgi:acetylornithine/succinyldiaminopimelate/putrescine aminotransferase
VAGAAMLTTPAIAQSLRPGMHASTFGGNPLAARAGIATIETIEEEGLLAHATAMSERFAERLAPLKERCPLVQDIRIAGLMIGIELAAPGTAIVQQCIDRQLLINCTQSTVIRLLPALNIQPDEVDEGCEILSEVLVEHAA